MKFCLPAAFLAFWILLPFAASAEELPQNLIEVGLGTTNMDLTGDGEPDKIVRAYRQNFNSYSYYVTLFIWNGFYGPDEITENSMGENIIGIETGNSLEHELTSGENKLCAAYGYRLLFKNKKTYLITAQREPVDGYVCENNVVTFRFYDLRNDRVGMAGWTEYYFKDFKTWATEKKYEDVMMAWKENGKQLINMVE